MIYDNFLIYSFEPLQLIVENIGPFRDGVKTFDFTDNDDEPCNFFLLISKNGLGKTTILNLMTDLMSMLENREMISFRHEGLKRGKGRVQWDIRVRLRRNGYDENIILSLLAGSLDKSGLFFWEKERLAKFNASSWHRFGYRRHISGRLERIGKGDEVVEDLLSAIKMFQDDTSKKFQDDSLTMPTILYFSAYRDIPFLKESQRSIIQPDNFCYKPVHIFEQQGEKWDESLDNLLVWFKWLDDGRFENAQKIINEYVLKGTNKFLKGIRRQPPEAIVVNENNEHRLDQLSSGEKSLVQLFLRIGAHMTGNTILLIDEMDVHLHLKLQHRLLNILKGMAKDFPGLTIIGTTHSVEIMQGFAFEVKEKGLRKGGHLIEEDIY